jgi:hypothetical protein
VARTSELQHVTSLLAIIYRHEHAVQNRKSKETLRRYRRTHIAADRATYRIPFAHSQCPTDGPTYKAALIATIIGPIIVPVKPTFRATDTTTLRATERAAFWSAY